MGGIASGYLDNPITDKEVSDGVSKLGMSYGAASMQGWRSGNEDAMSCLPDFTDDSAMFAVYDGHGGPEIALYTAKYLPMLLKTHYAFKSGTIEHALREAFLAVDKQITLEETIDELQTLAGTKPDDDEEGDQAGQLEEMQALHEEASLPLADLLAKYKQQMADCIAEEQEEMEEKANFLGSGKGKKPKKSVEEEATEEGAENGSEEKVDQKPEEGAEEKADEADVVIAAAAAVEGAVEDITKVNISNGAGTSNGNAVEEEGNAVEEEGNAVEEDGEEEEEDEEYEESEEEEGSGSAAEESESEGDSTEEEGDLPPTDEREGYGSGTTACVAVLKDGVITVANVGDSRCVVCTEGISKDLSVDHKPEDEGEKQRIEKAGGRINKEGRVNGGLNLSRALGDHQYKNNEELLPEEQMISPLPDFVSHTITKEDEFMILACDGIWNCLNSQEAVDFVKEYIDEARKSNECSKTWLSDISGKLMDSCMAPDTSGDGSGCDNMTCIIIILNQEGQSKRKLDETEPELTDKKKAKVC